MEPIELHPQQLLITPQFYIFKVEDNRLEQKAVAWIYPQYDLKQKPVLQAVDLKGGGLLGIQNFVWQSFPQNKKRRPVLIHLKECKVTESVTGSGRIEGKVSLFLSFDLYNGANPVYLTDYRIDTKYTRANNQLNLPEMMLSSSLVSALKYFDSWMNNQANKNPKLATEVKVTFINHQERTEGDTIYYAVNRPITWSDFQEKARAGKYAAMVFPSFGFEEKSEIVNGIIRVRLEMKVYLPKSACWVKDGYHDDYTLNHEQRHFDLVAIVGKRFEQKIKATKLPIDNFDGLINVKFYESFREMNDLQKQYDNETEHGINKSKQQEWNAYIDKELLNVGIVKSNL